MNISGGDPFVPGPYPKHVLSPREGPDAIYSGLLECPLTDRIAKEVKGGVSGFENTTVSKIFQCGVAKEPQACEHSVETAATCFSSERNKDPSACIVAQSRHGDRAWGL